MACSNECKKCLEVGVNIIEEMDSSEVMFSR